MSNSGGGAKVQVDARLARTVEYATQLGAAGVQCPFCQGGNAFLLPTEDPRDGKPRALINPEVKLWEGSTTYAHYNSWPAAGTRVIGDVPLSPNGKRRQEHFVIIPRCHKQRVGSLHEDEATEIQALLREMPRPENGHLPLPPLDLWYCRQGKEFGRTGATISHLHFHSCGIEAGEKVEVGFGPWGKNDEETNAWRAQLPRFTTPTFDKEVQLRAWLGNWFARQSFVAHPGIARHYVLELDKEGATWSDVSSKDLFDLFQLVARIEENDVLPAANLWFDRKACGSRLSLSLFLPEPNQLVICQAG